MKKIKKIIINIAKKNKLFRKVLRKTISFFRNIRYSFYRLRKVDAKTIIFSCFDGKSYTDSPKALYEYMIKDKVYDDYTFIWMFNKPKEYTFLANNKNTLVIKNTKSNFEKYTSISSFWIFNYKIADYLKTKKGQKFVQCWHGTPLKRLGCDLIHYDSALNSVEEMKNRYKVEADKFDYFISPSKYATEKFISAWNLKETGKDDIIIEEGYPRNDFLSNYKKSDVTRLKKEILGSYHNDKRKIILYAPTYRANQHQSGVGYTYKNEVDFDRLRKEFGDEYIILFRPHYFIASQFDFNKYEGFVFNVSEVDDINDLYIISDLLITDYSSVFFDYSILKRPMIFYMYDLDYYKNESNGFYFDVEKELPGPIVKDEDSLIKAIKDSKKFKYTKKYEAFNNKYTYLDDGASSKRVIEKIMNKK